MAHDIYSNTSGILHPEHADYCMAWKGIINPKSQPMTVIYSAMGPDIITPLLLFDPEHIIGIDCKRFDAGLFKGFLDYNISGDGHLLERISWRKDKGYWDDDSISRHGLEKCLAQEMSFLGIGSGNISFSWEDKHPSIIFDWAYPGLQPKKRRLTMIRSYAAGFLERSNRGMEAEAFYQKSRNRHYEAPSRDVFMMQDVRRILKKPGYVLLGEPDAQGIEMNFVKDQREMSLMPCKPMDAGANVAFDISARLPAEYGWKLEGFIVY